MGFVTPKVTSVHFDRFVGQLPKLTNKVYVITGTTTGTGLCAAKALVEKGAHVVVLNRSSDRADAALQSLTEACTGDGRVTSVPCDLLSFDSVRDAGAAVMATLEAEGVGLDGLVCNAGIMASSDFATRDGYDVQMQTNHLSHFLLASILLPSLERAAAENGSARVVTHTSVARKRPTTWLDAQYLQRRGGNLGGDWALPRWERYHQSKLANIVFAQALQDKLHERGNGKIMCLSATPGVSATSLHATTAADGESTGFDFIMRFCQSAEDGSMPLLNCVADPAVRAGELYVPGDRGPLSLVFADGVTGWPRLQEVEDVCRDAGAKSVLWEESERAVGPFFREGTSAVTGSAVTGSAVMGHLEEEAGTTV